jgi:hypothetical protein
MMAQEIVTTHNAGDDRQTYWANRINGHLRKSVEEIIQAGLDLIGAKDDLGPGKFTAMVEKQLRVTLRTAEMLMKVASHPVLRDPNHGSHLPPSWRTLSELALLPAPLVQAKIEDGTINPEMQRKDVPRFRPGVHAEPGERVSQLDRFKEKIKEKDGQIADLEERLTSAEAAPKERLWKNLLKECEVEMVVRRIIWEVDDEERAKAIAAGILKHYKRKPGRPAKAASAH